MKKPRDYSDPSEAEQREDSAITEAAQPRMRRDIDPDLLDETNTPLRIWEIAWEDVRELYDGQDSESDLNNS